MKRIPACLFFLFATVVAADVASDWKYVQQVEIPQAGLVKLGLPPETLDAARPGLEDLRILDSKGREVSYLVDRPIAGQVVTRSARDFHVRLDGSTTILDLETGVAQPINGITLDTPASSFIKAVSVEGASDQRNWQKLATGQPIFRQPNGANQLRVAIAEGVWRYLRVTVGDRRSEAVPFTGARIHATSGESAPAEALPATLVDRTENDGQTRLNIDLGASHLTVASLRIETKEPLFTRPISVAVRQVAENAIAERVLFSDTIYRVDVDGFKPAEHLEIPLDATIQGRELLVLIDNRDNQPLQISAIHVERRPVYATFLAQQGGLYKVLTGNPRCAAPSYDVAAFASRLKGLAASPLTLSSLAANPLYRPGEALPEIQDLGTPLDISEWQFRKRVQITRAGVQQIELDVDVLSHADLSFRDLRLVRDGKQRPYVLERTSIARKLIPEVSTVNDPKRPTLSRWVIKLPQARLPLLRLTCVSTTPLFRRQAMVYEQPADERGEKYDRPLGQASWVRTPPATKVPLEIYLNTTPQTDTLILDVDNGDNPPISLDEFQLFHPVTRVLFKAPVEPDTFLYFGNRDAGYPQYDLDLVAPQLLAEEKSMATLAASEPLRKSSWGEIFQFSRTSSIIFWIGLAAMVIVLLFVISRLLPKNPPSPGS